MKWLRPSAIVYVLISFYIKLLSAFEQSIALVLSINYTNKPFKTLYTYILKLFRKPGLQTMENQ